MAMIVIWTTRPLGHNFSTVKKGAQQKTPWKILHHQVVSWQPDTHINIKVSLHTKVALKPRVPRGFDFGQHAPLHYMDPSGACGAQESLRESQPTLTTVYAFFRIFGVKKYRQCQFESEKKTQKQ